MDTTVSLQILRHERPIYNLMALLTFRNSHHLDVYSDDGLYSSRPVMQIKVGELAPKITEEVVDTPINFEEDRLQDETQLRGKASCEIA